MRQIFDHLRHRGRAQGQGQPFIGGAEIDHQGNLRAFNVLEKNQRKFILALELLDNAAGFVTRINFFIDDHHVLGALFQEFI
jgi:hypothetical protein